MDNFFEYKGKQYKVIDKAAFRRKDNGWVACVIYKSVSDEPTIYVRDASEFFEKFKLINQQENETIR
jgi:hypothetical protein